MNTEEKQYIGILASEREILGSALRDIAFVNQYSEMQYAIKVLSNDPLPQRFFSGYINCLDESCDIEDDYYLTEEDRIDNFLAEVEDKIFVFSYTQKAQKFYNISEAYLAPIPPSFNRNEKFVSVPVFCSKDDREMRCWEEANGASLYREYDSYEEFVSRIEEGLHAGRVLGYDAETSEIPSFVIWKEADGTLYAVNMITGFEDIGNQRVMLKGRELNRYELSYYENKFIYNEWVNPTLLFLPENAYQNILEDVIIQKEMQYSEEVGQKTDIGQKDEVQQKTEVKQKWDAHHASEEKFKESSSGAIAYGAASTGKAKNVQQQEEQFLSSLKYSCQSNSLQYKESDLLNFHTAIKCSDLVVLSGMSGTGKSALVDMYAKTLGITAENKQFLFIPVCPSWNDDADLLGHIDLVNKVYHASDTGFVNLLVEAQKEENQDKLYLVCFDEMNLARVEHYFSQFLSILEKPSGQRNLILYDAQYSDKLENAKEYPWKITIGDNIKFIGTVNIDESTYHFSDKVLDRANVITLDIMDYSKEEAWEPFDVQEDRKWSASEYRSMVSGYRRNQELRCLLWEMHTTLQNANIKLGVGPRIVKCIEQYLANLPEGENIRLTMDEAVDYQIAQRVLTKVRGSELQLGNLLGNDFDAGILSVFDKYSQLSMFTKSRQIVKDKRRELESYGYCV